MEVLQTVGCKKHHSIADPIRTKSTLPSVQCIKTDGVTIDSISDADHFFYLDPYLRPYNEECGETDLTHQDIWICNLGLQGDKHIPAIPAIYQLDSNNGRAVYVCGVPSHYTEEHFKILLSEYGTIVRCPVIIDTTSQQTFRWAIMQTKSEASQLLQIAQNQQNFSFKVAAYVALPPGRSIRLVADEEVTKCAVTAPAVLSSKEPLKQFPTIHSQSIWQSRINLPPISSYLKTRTAPLKHPSYVAEWSDLATTKKRRLDDIISSCNSRSRLRHQPARELAGFQGWPAQGGALLYQRPAAELYPIVSNNGLSSALDLPYSQLSSGFTTGNAQYSFQGSGIFPQPVQIQSMSGFDPWNSTNAGSVWPQYTSEYSRSQFKVSNPAQVEKKERQSVGDVDGFTTALNAQAEAFDITERQPVSSKLHSPPSTSSTSGTCNVKPAVKPEQGAGPLPNNPPTSADSLPQPSSWARIASKASPTCRIIDLHSTTSTSTSTSTNTKPSSSTSSSTSTANAPTRLRAITHACSALHPRPNASPEPLTEQMRVVFLLDLPHSLTASDISSAVKEGPLRSIHFGTDEESPGRARYAAIVFQHARDAAAFAAALLRERASRRPERFRFIVDVARGEEPFPLDDVLRAMGAPAFATRRLTLVKASFFFMVGERQLRLLCDKVVGGAAVQLVWIYNGGNATIVFVDVGSAMLFKAELDGYAAGAGRPSGQSAIWSGLSVTYSKDPCIAPLELKTAMHD